jgi:hypothetical protein
MWLRHVTKMQAEKNEVVSTFGIEQMLRNAASDVDTAAEEQEVAGSSNNSSEDAEDILGESPIRESQ